MPGGEGDNLQLTLHITCMDRSVDAVTNARYLGGDLRFVYITPSFNPSLLICFSCFSLY